MFLWLKKIVYSLVQSPKKSTCAVLAQAQHLLFQNESFAKKGLDFCFFKAYKVYVSFAGKTGQ
jgi:hypothetical protein